MYTDEFDRNYAHLKSKARSGLSGFNDNTMEVFTPHDGPFNERDQTRRKHDLLDLLAIVKAKQQEMVK